MVSLASHPVRRLSGCCSVPGDKSISHRALIIGACAVGDTRISGLLESEDVMATASALRVMGTRIDRDDRGTWRVIGRGIGGLAEPIAVLDLGNSGTGARLLMGIAATSPFTAVFTGDASLATRPMGRVITPLSQMGATFSARDGGRMPITVVGSRAPMPLSYESPVASAQVKSAILLAALNTPGATTVTEPQASRDHTERMLADFGVPIRVDECEDGRRRAGLRGETELIGRPVVVPGDISSAAFPVVAALITPGSCVSMKGVGVNPLRTGLLTTLGEMGATIRLSEAPAAGHEPVADIVASAEALVGVTVPAERIPTMIDEIPILAVAASFARGTTRLTGVGELRVKESDRLGAIARGLQRCGVAVEEGADDLVIHGAGEPPRGGAEIAAAMDHRIAMSFLVLGSASREPVRVDDCATIATSFPGFADLMSGLGADLRTVDP